MANKRWQNLLKLAAKITFSSAFLFLVFRKINLRDILEQFQKTDTRWIILALVFFIASKFLSAIRLNHFFKSTGLYINEADNLRLYGLGMYYNMFLPGGIGGDGYKVFLLNKKSGWPARKLFWAVLLDRVSGLGALFLFSGLLALLIFREPRLLVLIFCILLVGMGIYYFMYRKFFAAFMDRFTITNMQGLGVQILQLICAAFILKAIGVEDHYREYLLLFLISSVVAIFPFTIGGLGAREICFLYGSAYFGLNQHQAVTISFWFYCITLLVSLSGIVFVFRNPFHHTLPRFEDPQKSSL